MRLLFSVMVMLLLSVPAMGQTLLGTNVRVDPDGIVVRPSSFWLDNVLAVDPLFRTVDAEGRLILKIDLYATLAAADEQDDIHSTADRQFTSDGLALKQDADTAIHPDAVNTWTALQTMNGEHWMFINNGKILLLNHHTSPVSSMHLYRGGLVAEDQNMLFQVDVADGVGPYLFDFKGGDIDMWSNNITNVGSINASAFVQDGINLYDIAAGKKLFINLNEPLVYDAEGDTLHFEVEWCASPDFASSTVYNRRTEDGQADWYYFNGSQYVAFPSTGLISSFYGTDGLASVILNPPDTLTAPVYIRARSFDGVDWSDYRTAYGVGAVRLGN